MIELLKNPTLLALFLMAIAVTATAIFIWSFLIPSSKELAETRNEQMLTQHTMDAQIEVYIESIDHIVMVYDELFIQLKGYLDFYQSRFRLSDSGRTVLNRELMYHKIEHWYPILYRLAEDIDECFKGCHSSKIINCDRMPRLFTAAFQEGMLYTKFMDNPDLVSIDGISYSEKDREIMRRYMTDFVTGIHHSKEVIVEEWVKSIWASKSAPNCVSKARDCFMIYRIAFQMAKVDSENLVEMLDDNYEGESFLGIIIGPAK